MKKDKVFVAKKTLEVKEANVNNYNVKKIFISIFVVITIIGILFHFFPLEILAATNWLNKVMTFLDIIWFICACISAIYMIYKRTRPEAIAEENRIAQIYENYKIILENGKEITDAYQKQAIVQKIDKNLMKFSVKVKYEPSYINFEVVSKDGNNIVVKHFSGSEIREEEEIYNGN